MQFMQTLLSKTLHGKNDFSLPFPDLPPVSICPSWLAGVPQVESLALFGAAAGPQKEKKKGSPCPWDHIFVFHFPRNSAALPHTFFKCLNPSICIHVKQLLRGSIQNKEHASYQLFSDILAALAQTGQIRSKGCSHCLPSVPFPILLPKDTVGAISMLIKELCLVP